MSVKICKTLALFEIFFKNIDQFRIKLICTHTKKKRKKPLTTQGMRKIIKKQFKRYFPLKLM